MTLKGASENWVPHLKEQTGRTLLSQFPAQ